MRREAVIELRIRGRSDVSGAGCCAKGPATTEGGRSEEFPGGAVGMAADWRKETEADWEKEQWRKGWEEGQRSDRAEEHQEVVGKGIREKE